MAGYQTKATVYFDGLGGIAVISAPELVRQYCQDESVWETFDTNKVEGSGVFEIELDGYMEGCDCRDGMPCIHDDYLVFDVIKAERVASTVSFKSK